jgi:hypothetical protein
MAAEVIDLQNELSLRFQTAIIQGRGHLDVRASDLPQGATQEYRQGNRMSFCRGVMSINNVFRPGVEFLQLLNGVLRRGPSLCNALHITTTGGLGISSRVASYPGRVKYDLMLQLIIFIKIIIVICRHILMMQGE